MRILLIEDERKLATAMQRALELQKYAVDVAYDGEQGLDLAVSEPFDVIIMDIMLPKLDGVDVCKKIREFQIDTPILLLTAKGQIADKVAGLDAGADDYMVKPFSLEELFSRIRALVRRTSVQKSGILSAADLTLNPSSFKVQRAGKNIELSSKEFSILEYLLRHKNTVISKEHIVNHVWNYDSDVLPSTVEVHVKHLRDKIDVPFSAPLLYTVRGFGYEIREGKHV